MSAPAGIYGQIGFGRETVVGTPVVANTFHAGLLSESLKQEIARIESKGLRAGRRTTSKWKPGARTVGGTVTMELFSAPMRLLLEHMLGTVATTGTGPFTHTATPGVLTGKSFTTQVGRPDLGGVVRPFTYAGCKIASWELSGSAGELAELQVEVTAQSETTAQALAVASYPAAGNPFTFVEGSLSVAGSPLADVTDFQIEGNNGLATDRHRFGSANVREQLENDWREYTGSITSDFVDMTAYQRYVDGVEASLSLVFNDGTHSLTVAANVRFDGETPELSGPEMLTQNLPFKALSATSDAAAITVTLVNDENGSA